MSEQYAYKLSRVKFSASTGVANFALPIIGRVIGRICYEGARARFTISPVKTGLFADAQQIKVPVAERVDGLPRRVSVRVGLA